MDLCGGLLKPSEVYQGAAIEYCDFLVVAVNRGIARGSRGCETRPESGRGQWC